ncbi:MAG: site-specific integrase [Actinobacteria bacterium]|nr:site-specific integrase [Actinomycetota bacterium]
MSVRRLEEIPGFNIDRVAAAAGDDPEVLRMENLDTDIPPPAEAMEATRAAFQVNGRQVMQKLGPAREPGSTYGLTQAQAEAALRRGIDAELARPPLAERVDVGEAGRRYLLHLGTLGRKRTTLGDYESTLRVHLAPFFAGRSVDRIDVELVEAFIHLRLREGRAPKSVLNYTGLLHAIFAFAIRRGWCSTNPVALADKPHDIQRDTEIRFLTVEELEALIRAVPDDEVGAVERVLYRTAAMAGLRRGELLALRWQDVDWTAGVIRVCRNHTRGEFTTPKSRRSSRAVPLADALAAELDRRFQRSRFTGDDDLVFAHPQLGTVLDSSKLRKRFVAARDDAGVRKVRFHDLRRTFGTRMAAAGAPLRSVQEWMGHSDLRTTLIYAQYAPDQTQGARYAAIAFAAIPETASIARSGGAE